MLYFEVPASQKVKYLTSWDEEIVHVLFINLYNAMDLKLIDKFIIR